MSFAKSGIVNPQQSIAEQKATFPFKGSKNQSFSSISSESLISSILSPVID